MNPISEAHSAADSTFFIQFLFTFNWHINTIWIGGVPCGTSALAYNAQRSDPEGAITISISANS